MLFLMDLENLKKKSVEVTVNGHKRKIVEIEGQVEYVEGYSERIELNPAHLGTVIRAPMPTRVRDMFRLTGYQKSLFIYIESKSGIESLVFEGDSPVRRGDLIRAGIFLNSPNIEDGMGEVLYLGIIGTNPTKIARRDFMNDYDYSVNNLKLSVDR